ncbi:MAG: addiction module protein, partial [Bacteroidota bacterium]
MSIREQISKLSPAEQILLVEEIWDEIKIENKSFLSDEKKKFLDERIAAIQKGEATFVTLDEIKKRFN